MKYILLLISLLISKFAYSDLFDTDPELLCNLFKDEGVTTSKFSPDPYSKRKLCYTSISDKEWVTKGYRLDYRVLEHWKWRGLTGKAFISIEGLESRIVKDDVLSKYKRMVYTLLNNVTRDTDEGTVRKITNAITTQTSSSQSIEAIHISSSISRRDDGDEFLIKYRVDLSNHCFYHPTDPGRDKCIATYREKEI